MVEPIEYVKKVRELLSTHKPLDKRRIRWELEDMTEDILANPRGWLESIHDKTFIPSE